MVAETEMAALVAAARWAHDKLNEDHDTCDCTCVACCGCFTEWLGDHKNYEEWCPLGAALRDFDALDFQGKPLKVDAGISGPANTDDTQLSKQGE